MLSFFIAAAVAAVVGTTGGVIGARLSITGLRRDHIAALQGVDRVADDLRRDISERPMRAEVATRRDVEAFLHQREQGLAQVFVTREELRPILKEVITREELDLALSAVVTAVSKNSGLPLPAAPSAALPVVAANQDQFAAAISGMSRQMAEINQQLGL